VVSLQDPTPAGGLAARWPEWAAGYDRRAQSRRKALLYQEKHLPLVHQRIRERLQDPEVAGYVALFASRSPNLYKAVVDAVAVAYRRGVQRELRGVSEATARAFADIVAESGIDRKGNGINAKAWHMGPTIVSPHLDTRLRLALDVVTPDRCEVKREGSYITAVLWCEGSTWIEIDESAWRYFNSKGEETKRVEHAAGVCPAVAFVAIDNEDDWWSSAAHQGLADASLDVAYKMALGGFNRNVSGNKLLVIQGNIEGTPPGQSLGHPALPLYLRGTPAETDVKLLDRIVPASDHLSEVAATIAMAVSVYGIQPGEFTVGGGGLTITINSDRLGVFRDLQVPLLHAGEMELWPEACDLLRGTPHRHARVLPPGDEARELLRVWYPDLASPDETKKAIEAMEAGLRYGITSPLDWALARRPELTKREAEETQQEKLATFIRTIDPLVARNIPAQAPDATGYQTLPQQQGREGGRISGEIRRRETP
jgi:hypothetical protein